MLELLTYMEKTLGSRTAVAEYLGYSERHYYNILSRVKAGGPLLPRVEIAVLHKLTLLVQKKIETVRKESQS